MNCKKKINESFDRLFLAKELHKPVRIHFQKRSILSKGIDDLWAVDSIDMKNIQKRIMDVFLISNCRRVLNLVCILLGISAASDCCMPTFLNTLSVPSS